MRPHHSKLPQLVDSATVRRGRSHSSYRGIVARSRTRPLQSVFADTPPDLHRAPQLMPSLARSFPCRFVAPNPHRTQLVRRQSPGFPGRRLDEGWGFLRFADSRWLHAPTGRARRRRHRLQSLERVICRGAARRELQKVGDATSIARTKCSRNDYRLREECFSEDKRSCSKRAAADTPTIAMLTIATV